jgi:hypothetical protein
MTSISLKSLLNKLFFIEFTYKNGYHNLHIASDILHLTKNNITHRRVGWTTNIEFIDDNKISFVWSEVPLQTQTFTYNPSEEEANLSGVSPFTCNFYLSTSIQKEIIIELAQEMRKDWKGKKNNSIILKLGKEPYLIDIMDVKGIVLTLITSKELRGVYVDTTGRNIPVLVVFNDIKLHPIVTKEGTQDEPEEMEPI